LYPEIQPSFIHQHYNKIGKKWNVVNNDGISRDLVFNRDYENPLIHQGWNEFKSLNQLPDNVEIVISYYSPTLFAIDSFKPIGNTKELPPFSSRCINSEETMFFDIQLDADSVSSPTLV
jgi:hypothetical protein